MSATSRLHKRELKSRKFKFTIILKPPKREIQRCTSSITMETTYQERQKQTASAGTKNLEITTRIPSDRRAKQARTHKHNCIVSYQSSLPLSQSSVMLPRFLTETKKNDNDEKYRQAFFYAMNHARKTRRFQVP